MTEWSRPDQAERFIREYADPILRVCAAYSLGRADAQDICQDIFLTLLEGERAFQSPEHERAFILRCAINASKDLLKSSHVRRTAPLEEAERVAAPGPGELHEVWQAVERLPAREHPGLSVLLRGLRSGGGRRDVQLLLRHRPPAAEPGQKTAEVRIGGVRWLT